MSAGTIALTNNSVNVTGTGTAFTTDLKAGDFVVVIVGGVTYTLGVKAITSATALTLVTAYGGPTATGNAWTAVPNATLVGITSQVAADVAKAIRGLNLDKANWQQVFSGTGNITVTLPDGSTYSGPAWNNISATLAKAYTNGGVLSATVTPNTLGNTSDFNIYYQTANANAVIANGYPIAKAGTLFVTPSAYGCQQMYITFQGEAFVRGLTGTFNPAAPNWSDWWPIFTGKSTIPVANGGTGATTAAAARAALGAFPSSGGTVAGAVTTAAGGGLAVAASEQNRVELNNATGSTSIGTPIGWTVYRWYNELAQVGARRAGDTTIQSYFVTLSGGGSWEFLRGGNATASGTWTSGSDERHKFDIEPVNNALAAVLTFRGATYGKKDGGREVGLIAQDVERACKEAITYNGDRKFSDGTVIPDFKYLNTSGASAAFHTEAIKILFELVQLAIDKPDDARTLIANIKAQSEVIKNTAIENEEPWKEDPPVFDVPSTEDYEEPAS